MSEAWIYGDDGDLAGELARTLAELGFSPRRVNANGALVPPADDGADTRRPTLVVVAAGAQEPAPSELLVRLRDHDELGDVPLLAVIDPEHLSSAAAMSAAQELLVLPF